MAANIKNIKPITGIGIKGYQVTFSILDMYKLKQLALETQDRLGGNELTNVLLSLFNATVGDPKEFQWDFLTSEEKEGE